MAITVRRERGQRRIVVAVTGALDASGVPTLRRVLARSLRTRAAIMVDLTEATSIHRDGAATLLAAHRQAERTGRPLLLRADPTQIRTMLGTFGIFPDDSP
jgi:anti-anti-sigma regulatory factor